MDTACSLEATVACGEIFSEDVNILQTERYFSRTFLEIFAIFINYPPIFANSAFQNIEQKFRVYVVIYVTRNFIFPCLEMTKSGVGIAAGWLKSAFPALKNPPSRRRKHGARVASTRDPEDSKKPMCRGLGRPALHKYQEIIPHIQGLHAKKQGVLPTAGHAGTPATPLCRRPGTIYNNSL